MRMTVAPGRTASTPLLIAIGVGIGLAAALAILLAGPVG
jgi:hypothetical protein